MCVLYDNNVDNVNDTNVNNDNDNDDNNVWQNHW